MNKRGNADKRKIAMIVTAQRFITRVYAPEYQVVKIEWAAGAGTARPVNLLPFKRLLGRLNFDLGNLMFGRFLKSQFKNAILEFRIDIFGVDRGRQGQFS